MTDPLTIYPLVRREGRWWLPHGPEADAEALARVFSSDCSVFFLGPEGGSFAYDVNDEGEEVVSLDSGPWCPLPGAKITGWRHEALRLVLEAIDHM